MATGGRAQLRYLHDAHAHACLTAFGSFTDPSASIPAEFSKASRRPTCQSSRRQRSELSSAQEPPNAGPQCATYTARPRRRGDRLRPPNPVANELDIDKILLRISNKDRAKSAPPVHRR